jgi:hypothetical protein
MLSYLNHSHEKWVHFKQKQQGIATTEGTIFRATASKIALLSKPAPPKGR